MKFEFLTYKKSTLQKTVRMASKRKAVERIPTCDKCQGFLFQGSMCCDKAICKYCATFHDCGHIPVFLAPSIQEFFEASFPDEWARKASDAVNEYQQRMGDSVHVQLWGVSQELQEPILRAVAETKSAKISVATESGVVPLTHLFGVIRFISPITKEMPVPEVDKNTCVGYIAIRLQLTWDVCVLFKK